MEEYFQEAGRAGRDGLPARAHMFFKSDCMQQASKNQNRSSFAYW